MAEVSNTYSAELMQAIDSQFKQVKSVGAGVPIEIDSDMNTDKNPLKVVKQISDSKKYGPSTQSLVLQSDFDGVINLWQECMEEQKLNAKVIRNNGEQLDEYSRKVDEQLQMANEKIDGEVLRLEDIGKQVKQSIEQIDSLNAKHTKLKYVQSI